MNPSVVKRVFSSEPTAVICCNNNVSPRLDEIANQGTNFPICISDRCPIERLHITLERFIVRVDIVEHFRTPQSDREFVT